MWVDVAAVGGVSAMTKTVRVTSAQVSAAKLKIKRSEISGKLVSPSVLAVANAKRATSLNGVAGPAVTSS